VLDDRTAALHAAQFTAAIERGEVDPSMGQGQYQASWSPSRIEALDPRIADVEASPDRLAAFERFSELESELETLEREVCALVSYVDGYIQFQLDLAREVGTTSPLQTTGPDRGAQSPLTIACSATSPSHPSSAMTHATRRCGISLDAIGANRRLVPSHRRARAELTVPPGPGRFSDLARPADSAQPGDPARASSLTRSKWRSLGSGGTPLGRIPARTVRLAQPSNTARPSSSAA